MKPGDRVEILFPQHGHTRTVRATVADVDVPGLPPGVRLVLDEPVNGGTKVYACHDEVRLIETPNRTVRTEQQ